MTSLKTSLLEKENRNWDLRKRFYSQCFLPKKELFCDMSKTPLTKDGTDVCVQLRTACNNLLLAVHIHLYTCVFRETPLPREQLSTCRRMVKRKCQLVNEQEWKKTQTLVSWLKNYIYSSKFNWAKRVSVDQVLWKSWECRELFALIRQLVVDARVRRRVF